MTKPETISIKEAADRIGISHRTAYTLIRKEQFPVRVLRVGSQGRVPVADLDRFLKGEDQ